jgi:tRNA (cytosine34-C5)-methyltransferase
MLPSAVQAAMPSVCIALFITLQVTVVALPSFALGAVQLVDVTSHLPGLKYRQGLTHWLPTSRDMTAYSSYSEVPEVWQTQIRPQMFPPAPADVGKFNLERW